MNQMTWKKLFLFGENLKELNESHRTDYVIAANFHSHIYLGGITLFQDLGNFIREVQESYKCRLEESNYDGVIHHSMKINLVTERRYLLFEVSGYAITFTGVPVQMRNRKKRAGDSSPRRGNIIEFSRKRNKFFQF